jgi:hypothetical protein
MMTSSFSQWGLEHIYSAVGAASCRDKTFDKGIAARCRAHMLNAPLYTKIFRLGFPFLLSMLILIMVSCPALADDVDITKARLIQKSKKSYVLEADVTQALVWAINSPKFICKTGSRWSSKTAAAPVQMWMKLTFWQSIR